MLEAFSEIFFNPIRVDKFRHVRLSTYMVRHSESLNLTLVPFY